MRPPFRWRSSCNGGAEALLENLAISFRRPAKPARRDSGSAMKGAHEVGEIAEPDVEGDVGDRAGALRQKARRAAQPRAHQVLVRRHAEDLCEEPQEMKRPEPDLH